MADSLPNITMFVCPACRSVSTYKGECHHRDPRLGVFRRWTAEEPIPPPPHSYTREPVLYAPAATPAPTEEEESQ